MSIRPLDLKRALIVTGLIFAWLLIITGLGVSKRGIALVSVLTSAGLAFLVVRGLYLFWNRRRNKIISWPAGFQYIKKGVPSRVYTWGEIKSLRHSRTSGWVYLSLHDGTEQRLFSGSFFGTYNRAARFVKEVNELREEYARRGQ